MEHGLVTDIAVCIIAAWLVAVLSQVARQPLLLAYLAAGFAIGPHALAWVHQDSIQTISSIGLALLLFMIGLEIDLKRMLNAGKVIMLTAAVQIFGCVFLGWLVFDWLGPAHSRLEALYLGVAAAMSSTVIIVKLLYDKRELETLAGRISLGVLVLQDLFIILFLALQPNFKNPAVGAVALALGKVLLLVAVAYMAGRFVLPPLFKLVARLPELVLVGALAWCFAMAGLADWLGLSYAMGALVAGVMVSTFPYTLDVVAKVTSIRDFFVTLFFVGLGMEIPAPTWNFMLWTLWFCLLIIGSRFITIFPPLYFMRQGYRVSLLSTINLCQLSELSLVLLALGAASGEVSENSIGIAAFSFAFLAVGSTYAILKNDAILRRVAPQLNRLGLRDLYPSAPETGSAGKSRRICLLGFSWTASSLIEEISREYPALLTEIVVVDFNPRVYERLRQHGILVAYGDITQRETLLHAGVAESEIIICSLPNTVLKGADNLKMLRQLRELNPRAQIIVHAELLEDIPRLYAAGASYVSAPRLLEAADLLRVIEAIENKLLDEKRAEQAKQLKDRNEVIP
ncbi:MAG TPA: cation:proton antiporter [Verrucomicrobiae bacterium]|nr:cation:proton antiporter [Verrucomicrobiae bacterium]